jgi:hypothetical protein
MITISFDIADLSIFEVHIDSATTGAHVACGLADLIADDGLSVNHWLGFHDFVPLHGWLK